MRGLRTERGAAAVEFALVLPILLVLIFGIVEFGRAFQVRATLEAAAREGARVMAVQNDPAAARTAVQSASTSLNPSVTADQIAITPDSCDTATAGTNAVVTISYTEPFLTGFFGDGIDLSVNGVMRCHG
jgi:Flp pilus assembly protein TadG